MTESLVTFELLDVTTLIPYVNNARTHSDEQVAKIASSIKEFGFLNPIIISDNNTILCGHGRFFCSPEIRIKNSALYS